MCEEGVDCFVTCRQHHDVSQWGTCPAAIQAIMLPPKSERHPILRVGLRKDGHSLNFSPLCRTCAETKSTFEGVVGCGHEDHERWIESVWTGLELKYAIQFQGKCHADIR